jgi:ABC-2 type transport system permease protein
MRRGRGAWWSIAQVELRRRLRNRSALVTAFLGPLALAVVFGVLLGGTSSLSITIGVTDADQSEVTTGFVDGLLSADTSDSPVLFVMLDAVSRNPLEDARLAVDRDDVDAAIVIPPGFGAAITTGAPADIEVVRDPSGLISGEIARSVAQQFASGIEARALAAAAAAQLGAPVGTSGPDGPSGLGNFVDSTSTAITITEPGGRNVDPAAFFGVSMSIMFLFFTVSFAARSVVAERANGLVPRMLASSAGAPSIVGGKVIAVSVLGLSGFMTVWAVTDLVFGAPWGSPSAVVVTMCATVLAVAGLATFVCALARTEQQADGYTSMLAFVLALLGGNFVGPGQAPAALQTIARFTPNGQAIDAFTRVAVDGAGVMDVSRQLSVLIGIGSCFGVIGLTRITAVIRP